MAKFYLRPQVYCDQCDLCLSYAKNADGEWQVQHPERESCPRSGEVFKAPTIELEPS